AKGVVIVFVNGSTLTGDEGATISTSSAMSIADAGGNFQYAETIVTAMPGGLYFFNAEPNAGNVVTPVDRLTTSCANEGSASTCPGVAHAIRWAVIECQ